MDSKINTFAKYYMFQKKMWLVSPSGTGKRWVESLIAVAGRYGNRLGQLVKPIFPVLKAR
jgi:hypothetical protein